MILESKLDADLSKPEKTFSVRLSANSKKSHKGTSTNLKAITDEPVRNSDSLF